MTATTTLPVLFATGVHGSRPAASAVGPGGLYACSTHSLIYQTDGSSWTTWATLTGTGLSDPMTTRGDIIVRDSSNVTARKAIGSANTYLGSDGTDPAYSAVTDAKLSTSDITTNNASTSKHGFAPKYPNDATKYLDGTGAYSVPAGSGSAGALVLLEEHTASASASLLFTTRNVSGQSGATIQSDYDAYLLVLLGLLPATNNGQLQLDVSTDGGSTYDTTSAHYRNRNIAGGGALGLDGPGSTHIFLSYSSPNISNAAAEGISGSVLYAVPQTASAYPKFIGHLGYYDGGQDTTMFTNGHYLTGGAAINAFRLVMSTGNTASGVARWYGVAK